MYYSWPLLPFQTFDSPANDCECMWNDCFFAHCARSLSILRQQSEAIVARIFHLCYIYIYLSGYWSVPVKRSLCCQRCWVILVKVSFEYLWMLGVMSDACVMLKQWSVMVSRLSNKEYCFQRHYEAWRMKLIEKFCFPKISHAILLYIYLFNDSLWITFWRMNISIFSILKIYNWNVPWGNQILARPSQRLRLRNDVQRKIENW